MESRVELFEGFFFLLDLGFFELDLTLESTFESTPVLFQLFVVVEVSSEGRGQVVELTFVFLAHFSQGDSSGVFLVNKLAEGSFSLDKAVRDVHLFTELGQPNNELNRLDVVGNDDQLSLLILNEFGHMVETELQVVRFSILDFLF